MSRGTTERGAALANRLGLKVVRRDGHDLRVRCVHCGSNDNGHIDRDSGVYNCWSCHHGLSAFDLAKVILNDKEAAKRLMIDLGMFDDLGPAPTTNGHPITTEEAFLAVCQAKRVPADAWRKYGAIADHGGVRVPMFGPDGEPCSSIHITLANGKGLYETGKPVGLFLPQRLPVPGETWLIVEGGKDAPALFAVGHLAAGLPGNRLAEKFAEMFRDVDVIILFDGDKAGRDNGKLNVDLLEGVAASVQFASFPDGMDARDVLKQDGPEGVERVIRGAKSKGVDYELITAAECLRRDYPLEYLIKGVLAKGEPTLVCAPLKACKTLIAADMAVSLIKGSVMTVGNDSIPLTGHFLGYFPVPRPVRTMMLWGESGWRGVQSNLRRIGNAAGVTEADFENLFVGVKLPKFGSPAHAAALDKEIKRTGAEVVIIDCLYLCGVSGDTSKNQFDMGELLKSIGNVFVENDCTLVLLHHTTKHIAVGEPLQLDNAAFAGVAEYAAQWLLLNRQKLFEPGSGHHDLWLTIGARAGHGGLYGVSIDEGPFVEGQDRDWIVQVMKPEEMRQTDRDHKEDAREAALLKKLQDDKQRITRAMAALERQHPEGNSKTSIRDRSGVKGLRLDEALSSLLNEGVVVECEFLRSNQKTPKQGFKLGSSEGNK